MSECKRCGHCCMSVGREFWMHGDYENKPQYPWLCLQAQHCEDQGDNLPCRMLILIDGVAMCLIHETYGYEAKPEVCKDYPELACHQETKTFKGQGVCSQVVG